MKLVEPEMPARGEGISLSIGCGTPEEVMGGGEPRIRDRLAEKAETEFSLLVEETSRFI